MSAKTRLQKLEQQAEPETAPGIVVCWDENPKPPGPGVKVVSWPDDDNVIKINVVFTEDLQ